MLLSVSLLAALFVKMPDNRVYYSVNEIPSGCVLTGNKEELVYSASSINKCESVLLQPGCYRAELRAGIGLANDLCRDHIAYDVVDTVAAMFSVVEPTTVFVLRDGDGNPGDVNTDERNRTGTFGGGASGVDSILVVGDRVWRANGSHGKTCIHSKKTSTNQVSTQTSVAAGFGGGGGYDVDGAICSARAYYYYSKSDWVYAFGGGGGGAPSGSGGANWQYKTNFINSSVEYVNAGTDGQSQRGGDGGDVSVCKNAECTDLAVVRGGSGGENVYYQCGGQVAVSYGGGGGGGSVRTEVSSWLDGGNGGSGSTDTSDTSFVRIYKM